MAAPSARSEHPAAGQAPRARGLSGTGGRNHGPFGEKNLNCPGRAVRSPRVLTGVVADGAERVPVALVAGATRGAGRAIAVELARAGFFVYATGRSSRAAGPSEIGRPETIEETGDLIGAAGGAGAARVVDHEDPGQVAALVAAIGDERGRLDVLVNDIFGGDRYMQWDKPLWEHDLPGGLRMLRMGVHTHLITCQAAIPVMLRTAASHGARVLVVEMTDGTSQANAEFRRSRRPRLIEHADHP